MTPISACSRSRSGCRSTTCTIPAALQLARPLNGVDSILSELRLVLFLVFLGGIALAAGLGRLAARRALAPLAEVAQAAQHIGETEDLSNRIRVHADDEVGQLATRFNCDARSPRGLARRARRLDARPAPARRRRLARAAHAGHEPADQHRGAARGRRARPRGPPPPARRRRRAERGADRARHRPDRARPRRRARLRDRGRAARRDRRRVDRALAPQRAADPDRIAPAAGHARRRARRGSSARSTTCSTTRPVTRPLRGIVEVTVDGEGVTVRDHGPGVDEQDLPYVFDRFFRGTNSRGRQGSGLGLAIVRQVTEQHGGSATVTNAPDGGAVFKLHLPVVAAAQEDVDSAAGTPRTLADALVGRPGTLNVSGALLGSGRTCDPCLPGRQELTAQEPEQQAVQRHDEHQQQELLARRAERRDDRGLGAE